MVETPMVDSSDLEQKLISLPDLRFPSHQKGGQKVALIVFFAVLGGLFFASYWQPIGSWFYNDDPHWIGAVASNTVWDMLFVPEVVRGLTPNFTPWLAMTFKADSVFFGLAPLGYHLHDLAALIAASLALFVLARKWMSMAAALAAVLLLWASPITLATATWSSTRHYVEGLLFALLAIGLAMKPGWKAALGAGGLYFLSAAAKEVYVVIPAVAWLLVEGRFLERWRRTAYMWIGLGLYTVWRLTMMAGLGGYITNAPLTPAEAGTLLAATARSFAAGWFGGHLWPVAALVVVMVVGAAVHRSAAACLAMTMVMIPLLPIAHRIDWAHYSERRYVFHLSVAVILGLTAVLDRWWRQESLRAGAAVLLFVGLFLAMAFASRAVSRSIVEDHTKAKRFADELLQSKKPWVRSRQPFYFYSGLIKAVAAFEGRDLAARPLPPLYNARFATPERLDQWSKERAPIDVGRIIRFQERFSTGPISVRFELRDYEMSWTFGPATTAEYCVLLGSESGLYYIRGDSVPARGRIMLSRMSGGETGRVVLRVLYSRGDGRFVVAPELSLSLPSVSVAEASTGAGP